MKNTFRITICQLNPIVGNFQENLLKVVNSWNYAKAEKADMLALPEMFITGYQTQDLVLKSAFIEEAQEFIKKITQKCSDGPAIGIGHPVRKDKKLYNAYSILKNGKVTASVLKQTLPNNSVFDEKRLFSSGPPSGPYAVDNILSLIHI